MITLLFGNVISTESCNRLLLLFYVFVQLFSRIVHKFPPQTPCFLLMQIS